MFNNKNFKNFRTIVEENRLTPEASTSHTVYTVYHANLLFNTWRYKAAKTIISYRHGKGYIINYQANGHDQILNREKSQQQIYDNIVQLTEEEVIEIPSIFSNPDSVEDQEITFGLTPPKIIIQIPAESEEKITPY
ncbi:unnamed protein product [Rhizophagus irregularis]|nr:unnamed protein product [Rhizophagus irregularis]CAB4443219.1 unnamed protein product [Rhizophagus irregularis]